MASQPASRGDLPLALSLLVLGLASAAIASRQSAAAFDFIPSMDGCVTAGCVGFVLALASGAPFRQALSMLAPIVGVQLVGARVHNASLLATLGIDALVVGLIGTALALRARPAAPRSPAQPQKPRLSLRHPAHA
jgi:hypothetical protein